ncbi:type II secretion system F family protein [Agromyces aerolatus]|uniref:type II secretion system F family protein n=1 Tax=Agromyces sp. LY-1074 TaxID=3074080 RepID=UPI00286794C3|nr:MULTISPECIES: type II secretion system F family protein [unclassified Agromyces]MDR5699018.1 type II secretion system F family protein [Agromyces sp. LY-1074]MDR5705204.1 type II secretion system F family protein [Agromyces sp. LY-1358]
MSLILGAALGLGLLLTVSPLVWPASRAAPRRHRLRVRWEAMRDELRLAGLGSVPVVVVGTVAIIFGAVSAAIVHAVLGLSALTFVGGILGLAIVPAAVHVRARARRAANRAVWPEVVDHLVAGVRAGMSLPDAIGSLATLGPAATRAPFAAFDEEYRRSGVFAPALDALKSRLADPVADRILETLRMAREVGGTEIVHVLRNLSTYLREDAAVRAEVRARQSWTRNAAKLGVAAPWILLVLLATKPETLQAYETPAGSALLLVGLVVSVIAYRAMIALGRIPGERRWFQ